MTFCVKKERQEQIDLLYAGFDEILYPKNGNISMTSPHWHPRYLMLENSEEPVPTIKEYIN